MRYSLSFEHITEAALVRIRTMDEICKEQQLALRAVMMPRETNPYGTIFGGVLLSYIDQAGAVAARQRIRAAGWGEHLLVTVAMNGVEFHEPVFVGDVLSFLVRIIKVGTTSITAHVIVETERADVTIRLTEAEVVYVAVASEGLGRQPVPIRGKTA